MARVNCQPVADGGTGRSEPPRHSRRRGSAARPPSNGAVHAPPKEGAVKSVILAFVLTLVGLFQPDVSNAFERRQFFVHGYVQWIAGEKLMLTADNGAIIAIDLTEADQSSYRALEQGEGITVAGLIKAPENADARSMPYLALWIRRDRQ